MTKKIVQRYQHQLSVFQRCLLGESQLYFQKITIFVSFFSRKLAVRQTWYLIAVLRTGWRQKYSGVKDMGAKQIFGKFHEQATSFSFWKGKGGGRAGDGRTCRWGEKLIVFGSEYSSGCPRNKYGRETISEFSSACLAM